MDQVIAMLAMVCDHIAENGHSWLSILGNLAMPIYVHRQAQASTYGKSDQLLQLSLVAELPYLLCFGHVWNVCWLFWVCAVTKDWERDGRGIEKLLVAGIVGGLMFAEKPGWLLWVPLLRSDERWLWYSIHGGVAVLSQDAQWLVHLLGYEVARRYSGERNYWVPLWLWRYFYPGHLLVLAGVRRVCGL